MFQGALHSQMNSSRGNLGRFIFAAKNYRLTKIIATILGCSFLE
jgi:hypothetical protein